jgi:hypothetical protein
MQLNAYQKAVPSPDGRYLVLTTSDEVRMSHWIDFAQLVDARTGRVIADVGSTSWSASQIAWSADGAHVELEARRYPGDLASLRVRLFPDAQVAELESPDGVERVPLAGLAAAMEAYFQRNKKDPWGRTGPAVGGPLDEATVAAFKAKGEALMREGKAQFTSRIPPRLEDLVQQIELSPKPGAGADTKAWLLVLKSGAVVLRYQVSESTSYFSKPLA